VDWFEGQTALVTGAAHGIGHGIAEMLASLGARVIAVDNDVDGLEANLPGPGYIRCAGDLASDAAAELAGEIWDRHGPYELLVNNVGIGTPHSFLDLEEPDFDRVFATNLRGPWFFTRRVVRNLIDARMGGAVVFVSSLHDSFVRARPHYSTSKAAVSMLTKELANELAPHGIRVNSVSPGAIRSATSPREAATDEALVRRIVPLGRTGEPADVARMVAVLLSDTWSGYVTGANVRVDGGLGLHSWTMKNRAAEPAGGASDRLLDRARRLARKPNGGDRR
jgi:glucose 1-dehydrogenase